VRFWDASAITPLIVRDRFSDTSRSLHADDYTMTVWCLSEVEVWSAISRKRHDGVIRSPDIRAARDELKRLADSWIEVTDVPAVIRRARRLLEVHRIGAADALQLAAALYAVGDAPERTEVVTFDERLADCAEREGFRILGAETG
jgi:predicted nucleic acid-binding protein